MENRRKFLQISAAALTAAATKPLLGYGIQGANNRIRMGIIGAGNRGGRVFDSFARHADCQFVAAAEVNKAKLDPWMTPARQTFKLDVVGDYRRILDRKDVDAVLIGDAGSLACAADRRRDCRRQGRLREKPASNTIPRINAMLEAYKKGKQVVQVGTQQRSWDHFREAKKFLDGGMLGTVAHRHIVQPGSYARAKEPEAPVPAGLDWECGRGRRRSKPFKPSRLGFRAWYDYGGGLVADWGAHHVDVAHWFMNADRKVPIRTSATGAFLAVPNADPEQVPDTFSIAWLYDNFIMTFAMPRSTWIRPSENKIENWGVFFIGSARLAAGQSAGIRRSAGRAARGPEAGSAAASDSWRRDARRRRYGDRARCGSVRALPAVEAKARGGARGRPWRRPPAADRREALRQSQRGRRGGLSARCPHAQFPRLRQVPPEAERATWKSATTPRCHACSRSSR